MKKSIIILSVLLFGMVCNVVAHPTKKLAKGAPVAEIGKTLPAWSEGCFDIHFINSARGECCFYILPDGTTLLVDAGEVVGGTIEVEQRPNAHTRPYITYANYIKHFLPSGQKIVDYCVATHFHTDHIGSVDASTESSRVGYRKSGLLALYDEVPYGHIFDSAYPDYESYEISGQLAGDWSKFVRWGAKHKKFKVEQFVPGEEQITMLKNADKYKNFSILNICAKGRVLGVDQEGNTRAIGKVPTTLANSASCGFHLRYGAFDYIACGDLVSSAQNRVAYYFRDFIGRGKLDAFKCHHHLAGNAWGVKMQEVNFDPRVVLNHCFTNNKPNVEKLMHVLPMVEGFFATNLHPDIIASPIVKEHKLMDRNTAYNGHIVLRVAPGGGEFYVYMLDDGDFEYRVKSIHGPYLSK